MINNRYCVVGRQAWNHSHFDEILSRVEGDWLFVQTDEELAEVVKNISNFRFVFFLHWSKKVPEEILLQTECVCFHMTDVPYGRGGSPLQNLITRGYKETQLTALRMTAEFDAGPVYLKEPLSLEGSTAEEIFIRASRLSCKMALRIARETPEPTPQAGDIVDFKRRLPSQSELPVDSPSLEALFDHIRMLDCEGYPTAFCDYGKYRFNFRRASLYHGKLEVSVQIILRDPNA